MGYDDREYNNNTRQKDLVLATNEYVYVQSLTNGQIKTYTGPIMLTISQQESLVYFDENSKQFRETTDFNKAKKLFCSAPENWYIVLKNPDKDNVHPEEGKATLTKELKIGQKININGPCSFSLWPGQMAKVIKGHTLRSNQYLLGRVYEAHAANANQGEIFDSDGKKIEGKETSYVNGQILVIKGTEVSFYIPPTGIEIIPIHNDCSEGYVRDAVTLERLEYCILKDEDGNKRYVHGPAVVFPEPTESFVKTAKGGAVYRAIELSPISGIYVKVIAAYKDDDGTEHPVGEELFITGNDQMIYYPRPEHTLISYDGKFMHHAIAIPEGEGRYIMNRLTGEIKTVKGPVMYLPDPRHEVVVKRKLSAKQCELWYPGNTEALMYNTSLSEKTIEKSFNAKGLNASAMATVDSANYAYLETNATISRGTSYTKPRTITLDTKYEGVVSVDVWTGYAVNVISKDGSRKVVCGPQTILLDYDQTLEELAFSTGKPKTTDHLLKTVYLRYKNNRVSDLINVETEDFVKCVVKVSYSINFDENQTDKWFDVDNYVKHLCDRQRSLMKAEVKNHSIEDFYQNYSEIIRNVAINNSAEGRFFPENGMRVVDCEVLSIKIDSDVEEMLIKHQREIISKVLERNAATEKIKVIEELSIAEAKTAEFENQKVINEMNLKREKELRQKEIDAEVARKEEIEEKAKAEAKKDLQPLLDAIQTAELTREKQRNDLDIAKQREENELEELRQKQYAETVKSIMESIQPDLIAALNAQSNTEIIKTVSNAFAPYAIANGESVADTTNKLLRGTSLEGILNNINN